MVSKRKFYREVITFEILSEEPIPDCLSLGDIHYHTTEGHMSGQFGSTKAEIVDGATMAKLLEKQGSDPEFFMLTPEGEDNEEWEDENSEQGEYEPTEKGGA